MNFSEALMAMKDGKSVCRLGWNGKGMWIEIQEAEPRSRITMPYICMTTVDMDRVPWIASQTDLLSDDWEIVPDV